MSLGLAYWVLMLIWLCWGVYQNGPQVWFTGSLLQFLLFLLAGWQIFGPPLHG